MFRCPFCAGLLAAPPCPTCGRDPQAVRRVCQRCKRMTPSAEPGCMHCGAAPSSDLAWKVPLIIVLFVAAFAISLAIALAR